MIWSERELANFSIVSANVIIERVYKHIDEPENIDIFNKENFSYLWGILGVAGIKGFPHNALDKLWLSLKENDVIEAFDKGVLGDFNKFYIEKYSDNRLRAWFNLDNFLADQKFKKMILMPLVAINRDYAHQVDMQAFNPVRVVGVLERYPLSEPIKQMLIDMQGHGAACGISGKEVVEHYEKEKVLTRICDIIAHSKRKFNENEKDFLFRYIHDAVIDGFDFGLIGLSDLVFERLMADETDENLSELELVPLRERNIEIVEFAKNFDEEYGFFELTAAKLIKNNPLNIPGMIERCLHLMDKTDPKGIVFASELVSLKQLRSAARILIALAKRGRATELISFLHRLLPEANGSEMMIMSILKLNLKKLKERDFFELDEVFREYPARLYIIGVEQFIEYGFYKEASTLLCELIGDEWINGFEDLRLKCRDIIDVLVNKNEELVGSLCSVAKKIRFEIYKDNDEIGIKECDESSDCVENKDSLLNVIEKEEIDIENSFDVISAESYVVFEEQVIEENSELHTDGLVNEENIVKDDIGIDVKEGAIEEPKNEDKNNIDVDLVEDIGYWEDEGHDKINVDNTDYTAILNVDEKDVENHFEKIKNIASSMVEKVEEKTSEIIKRVEDYDIELTKGLDKIKKIKEKFRFLKKK